MQLAESQAVPATVRRCACGTSPGNGNIDGRQADDRLGQGLSRRGRRLYPAKTDFLSMSFGSLPARASFRLDIPVKLEFTRDQRPHNTNIRG